MPVEGRFQIQVAQGQSAIVWLQAVCPTSGFEHHLKTRLAEVKKQLAGSSEAFDEKLGKLLEEGNYDDSFQALLQDVHKKLRKASSPAHSEVAFFSSPRTHYALESLCVVPFSLPDMPEASLINLPRVQFAGSLHPGSRNRGLTIVGRLLKFDTEDSYFKDLKGSVEQLINSVYLERAMAHCREKAQSESEDELSKTFHPIVKEPEPIEFCEPNAFMSNSSNPKFRQLEECQSWSGRVANLDVNRLRLARGT